MNKGRLNDIFDAASEAVLIFDSQAKLLYLNSTAQDLFQYTYNELESKDLLNLVEQAIHADVHAFLKKDNASRHVMEQKAFILPKSQQSIPANLVFSTITQESGNIHMLVVEPRPVHKNSISTDYKLLADSMHDTVSLYDAEQHCLYVNPAVEELYGYRQAEYQLKGGFFALIDEEERASIQKNIEEGTQQKADTDTYTYSALGRQEHKLPLKATVRRVFNTEGQLHRLIVFESRLEQSPQEVKEPSAKKVLPLLLLDADWWLSYMNQEATTTLGYTSEEHMTFFELLHPDDIQQALREKEGRMYNGIISSERTLRLRAPEGYSRFRVVFDKFFDTNGKLAYVSVRLYPSEGHEELSPGRSQHLKLLAEHVNEVVCFFRQDYGLDYISPSVKQTLGYDSEALVGISLLDLIHPDDRAEAEAFLKQGAVGATPDISCRFRKADGTYLKLKLDLRMLEASLDGSDILPFLALLRHVPHLSTIANPANLFTELSEHFTDAIAVVALPSLRIEQTNRHLPDIFNTSEEKLKGTSITSLFETSPELKELEQAMREGARPFHNDIRCIGPGQKPFWVNVAVSFFEREEQAYAFMRISDISERKAHEEMLREARNKAESTLVSREAFLSTMSHEIRTPLNAILGMTHLMLQGKPREDQIKLLQTLKFSGDSLTTLINDVLDFSKIEAGKLEFAREDFYLRDFLHNVKMTYKNMAQEKGLIFRTLLEEELPEVVNGDVHRLGQILNNLLSNAVKFTKAGHVILSVYMEAEEEDYYDLLFEVADTGIGIPQDKQSTIFDPYQQASERTSHHFGGTGLGLSIVKKLVDLFEGEIILQSEAEQGTTFKIRLKFAKPADGNLMSEQSDRSFVHEFQPLDGLKVLYVEDVMPNQFLMEGLCDTWQIELDTALDGLEALEKVKKNHYDLILMDIYMPGMSGFEAAQEIRKLQDPHYQQVPILALSASVSEQTRKRIVEQGMNDYIAKPVDPDTLHRKLSKYAQQAEVPVLEGESLALEDDLPLETIHPDTPDFSQLQKLYTNDRPGYVTIIKQIFKLSEESAAFIKQALREGDEKTFRSNVHKIMSYVRLMRLQRLQELLDKIKGHFEDHSQKSQPAIDMLNKHFDHFMAILEAEIGQHS